MKNEAYTENMADKDNVKKAERREKDDRAQELDDLKFVLSTKQGRRAVWRILCECGLFRAGFVQSGSQVYFNEGMRNVGMKLIDDVHQADISAYATMQKEAKGER